MMKRANAENWKKLRDETYSKCTAKLQQKTAQKTADIASEAAAAASRTRLKLLRRLEAEIDALPRGIGTETRETNAVSWADKESGEFHNDRREKLYRLRDFVSAWSLLAADLPDPEKESAALKEARQLLEGIDSAF